jgi:hypothetical protein
MPQHQLIITKLAQMSHKSVISRSTFLATREVGGFWATKGLPNTLVAISGKGWWENTSPSFYCNGVWNAHTLPSSVKDHEYAFHSWWDCNKDVATIVTNPHLRYPLALPLNDIRKLLVLLTYAPRAVRIVCYGVLRSSLLWLMCVWNLHDIVEYHGHGRFTQCF